MAYYEYINERAKKVWAVHYSDLTYEDFLRAFASGFHNGYEYHREQLKIAIEALEKIEDPRKRDHKEPDKYTECACLMNIASEALAKIGDNRK